MGNSISKKKAKASPSKVKAFWNFGRVDKFKAAGQKQDEQKKLTVHYSASQHYQENVFIEGSRPKYLEDLHTEAQEGLKILQQEEHNNGMDFKDDQTISTVAPHEDKDASCIVRDGHLDDNSTADHSITSVSSRSAVSSRPVLTRQGSTFKPLNTVKRLDKTRKRTRRTTIMGIPQQVQKELCMGKSVLLHQFPNGEDDVSSGTVIIPTINGGAPVANNKGARIHLQDIEALQASREEQLLRHHIHTVYRDDLVLNYKLGPRTSPMQRPKSLVVPGMTTSSFLQEQQGPVMSISPQATYLSTIIPNAVLPAAIDVIEIDRSRSRRSVRTLSKSSLASASPGSSRSGGCTHEAPHSSSSKWSHSQSSETVVSNSSTVSTRQNPPPSQVTDSLKEVTDVNLEEQLSFKSSSSWLSSSSKAASHKPGQEEMVETGENVRNSQFSRSLSIMKAKLPPAPPRRTNSLHQEKLKQRSKELVDTKDFNHMESTSGHMDGNGSAKAESTSTKDKIISTYSPAFLEDSHSFPTSSPHSPDQDSTDALTGYGTSSPQNKFERTVSPSSGYSSQSGTPTHSSKEICITSPEKHKIKPPKPERMSARTSPVVSVSSSVYTISSATTDPSHLSTQTHTTESQALTGTAVVTTVKSKATPTTSVLRELFNIPPAPKVKAPCPPPPETWAHNRRTVELLCGPSPWPNKMCEIQKDYINNKNQDTKDHTDKIKMEKESLVDIRPTELQSEDKEVPTNTKNVSLQVQEKVTVDETPALRQTEYSEIHEQETESCLEKETGSCVIEKQERKRSEDLGCPTKVPADQADQRVLSPTQQQCQVNTSALLQVDTSISRAESTSTEKQCFVKALIPNHVYTETVGAETPRATKNSPPPSPPPAYHPPPPPTKKPSTSSVSSSSPGEELQLDTEKENPIQECSWPPPPPPMEESPDLVFEGQDEIDFPPPPPPEHLSGRSEYCNRESAGQGNDICPEDTDIVSDISNQAEHNSELQIIKSPLPEEICNKVSTADVILNASEVSDNPSFDQSHVQPRSSEDVSQTCNDLVCSENAGPSEISSKSQDISSQILPEEILPTPHQEPTNSPNTSAINLSKQTTSEAPAIASDVPNVPPLKMEDQSTVPSLFQVKRQPSLTSKDNKGKELLAKHKSAPISKEDANIPLVTPSLLQMVRLRSVGVEDQASILPQEPETEAMPGQDQGVSSQVIPQKPVRKSCLKSTQQSVKSSPALAPSMRLQEAIRMKTAAMSSCGVPARLSLRLPTPTSYSNDTPTLTPKTLESCDLHKSPASTASFIFSKSPKKVVIETPTSPEVQATLKQNLAAELMQFSDQAKSFTNETKKHVKVPPPVAKKPAHAANPLDKLGTATTLSVESSSCKDKNGVENGKIETVQPAGQLAQSPGTKMPASTMDAERALELS
ncbi:NHS-like protein 3 isoform X2 [Hoplias malabaricus]|uniref:NHS-like protein 3 isoform X2 n=1 Tax=Hoplias malabaricus TaxID=27720 RepID=UPI00346252A8